mgnify:CR=1 FL=1
MRITESKLRRILRKVIVETFSDSQSTSRGSNLGKLPVGIDPDRAMDPVAFDIYMKAAKEKYVEEDMSQGEYEGMMQVLNRLQDCMTLGDDESVCAEKLYSAGLENAFVDVDEMLTMIDNGSEMQVYALEVAEIMNTMYLG